ncbi:membrane protein [Paramyrothecium foliicola]|nr:membrane protein [Paramyrothecium foliicola]
MKDPFFTLDKDAKPRGSASLAAVLSAFIPTWITGLLFVAAFIIIRQRFPKIYYPRTYMGTIPKQHRTPAAGSSYFGWARSMRNLSDKFILYHHSLDAYLFLRFLRTIIFICFVGSCLTWPTLLTANATGGGSSTQLDKVGIGNVEKQSHYYAHAVMAWVFFTFVMFTITRERFWLISLRQAWALSKNSASQLSSRTILFLSAPPDALEEGSMNRIFGDAAVRVWPAVEGAELDSLVADRNGSVEQLEVAETKLIRQAWDRVRKEKKNNPQDEQVSYESLSRNMQDKIRPRHHLGRMKTGEKVDSVQWLRRRIKEHESQIEDARQHKDAAAANNATAVFVEFKTVADAQKALQQVLSTEILALRPRFLGVSPKEVIWKNLFLSPERRISQDGVATALVTALILFWSIPSGLVGLLSNITYLADNVEWLAWLKNLPDPVMGLLSGLLPPLASSLLSKYVPNIFRFIFRYFGGTTTTANELKVQKWFYIFQVTQVFFVTAVFSGGATVFSQLVKRIKNPGTIPRLLARELPKSSNYYITYFIIQGITTSADNMLNWSDVLQYLIMDRLFDKTPRQKFNRYTSMKGISWGKVFPKYANFAIIAIAYSCIAPLVLGFATVGLILFYFSYRHNLLFVIQAKVDTRGQAYTLALQHLMTGVYVAELALIGLFGLSSATGPVAMLVILLLLTVLYNYLADKYLVPLERYLPAELASENRESSETAPLLASAEEGQSLGHAGVNIHQLGQQAHIPPKVLDPVARFFEPHKSASLRATIRWLREDDKDFRELEEETPEYSEEYLTKAYKNPVLTSSTPIVWLPKDDAGASKHEIAENEKSGLKSTDQGAWLDEKGAVRWNQRDFDDVPLIGA